MDARYQELIDKERAFWDAAGSTPKPQIWDDPVLQEIFFGAEERRLVERAAACGGRALEVGCGDGELALALARRGLRVTGIDLSEARIATARAAARAAGDGDNPRFIAGDLNIMPLPPGPFDVVLARDALHHIVELDALLERIDSVLAPAGRLMVFDFCGMVQAMRWCSAALYVLLPTDVPYNEKWRLRHRARPFLASQREKRAALERGAGSALHAEAPFEGISQEAIAPSIAARFEIVEHRTFLPFWWWLAPKLRLPRRLRPSVARMFRAWDDALQRMGARGAYFVLEARRRGPAHTPQGGSAGAAPALDATPHRS